jgi:hypothetical protein
MRPRYRPGREFMHGYAALAPYTMVLLCKKKKSNEYLISLTYSRIWLKFVFLPMVSLHAAPMQKRVLPASFA